MDKDILIQLIEKPQQISEKDLENLEEIVATYPYCQVAHLLIAKYTQDKESMRAPEKLRRAALYAYDRKMLRYLVNDTLEERMNKGLKIKTLVEQIDDQGTSPSLPTEESASFYIPESKDEPSRSFFDSVETEETNSFSTSEETPSYTENSGQGSTLPPDHELNESLAISLFNDGKINEAIQVYQRLAVLEPAKDTYYRNQIAILTGGEGSGQTEDTYVPSPPEDENETRSFFENIEVEENSGLEGTTDYQTDKDYENINEGKAMGLYYDGQIEEAKAMYQRLIELYPDKSAYYQEQLNTLIGPDTNTPEDTSQNQSFFEGIQEPESTSEDNSSATGSNDDANLPETNQWESPQENGQSPEVENQHTDSFFDQIGQEEQSPQTEFEPTDASSNGLEGQNGVQTEESYELDTEDSDYLNENQAILLFNQGNNEEAIQIYENLIQKNPQKASYYRRQISVLQDSIQTFESPQPREEASTLSESTQLDDGSTPEELNEHLAIRLFNAGKTEEAIDVYEKLMVKHPEKRDYFSSQIEILKS